MQKLTAIKARALIHDLSGLRTIREELFRQALEIALPVLEQQESQCQKCGGTGMADSGGTQPWGEQILVECDCQFEQQEKGEDGWIEWGGGECPVYGDVMVETKWSDDSISIGEARDWRWEHHSLISDLKLTAYRVIEGQP